MEVSSQDWPQLTRFHLQSTTFGVGRIAAMTGVLLKQLVSLGVVYDYLAAVGHGCFDLAIGDAGIFAGLDID